MVYLLLPAAYLLGGVPFGLLAGRRCGVDVREGGSGNIGATNVWRLCGPAVGAQAFILDIAKGVAPTLLARELAPDAAWLHVSVASCAILGHTFSPFLGFKGGKGVATSLGVLLALEPTAGIIGFLTWVMLVALTRYVSVASLAGTLAAGLVTFLRPDPWAYRLVVCAGVITIWVRHRANIARLLKGEELRFGETRREPDVDAAPDGDE